MDIIDDVSSGPNNDREFVNKIFAVVFPDAYLTKLIRKGMNRNKVLGHLRDTRRHHTIKSEKNYLYSCFDLIILYYMIN